MITIDVIFPSASGYFYSKKTMVKIKKKISECRISLPWKSNGSYWLKDQANFIMLLKFDRVSDDL